MHSKRRNIYAHPSIFNLQSLDAAGKLNYYLGEIPGSIFACWNSCFPPVKVYETTFKRGVEGVESRGTEFSYLLEQIMYVCLTFVTLFIYIIISAHATGHSLPGHGGHAPSNLLGIVRVLATAAPNQH